MPDLPTLADSSTLLLGFLVQVGAENGLGRYGQALLSTLSTFSHEIVAMTSARKVTAAAGYLLVTVGVGLGLSFAGAAIAQALWCGGRILSPRAAMCQAGRRLNGEARWRSTKAWGRASIWSSP
ncbi:CrcB family protein [Amycolatopsis taiwanensis]|uniref:CrcB family protein n=1 Tax=Amycolatopsis taiwanensis TaxID=342230 RepID=UPI00146FBD9A|nr:CrcB family protein [Amycolatopsis taiwanensis]